jgi:thiamine biosynthesis protein ThiS
MMVRVGGKEHAWWEGMTVADLLKELNDPYPYVVARINGSVISRPDFERTPIPDGAEVFLIPMIAGG